VITYHRTLRAALPIVVIPALASSCFGFIEIARGVLLLQTTASATYESYFLGTETNDPDTIYTLFPTLKYTRNAGRAHLAGSVGVAFNRYGKNTEFDSDELRANASIEIPTVEGSRLEGVFSIGYNESTDVDILLNDRIASETFSVNFSLNYRLASRIIVKEQLSYSSSAREIYSDQDVISNQLSVTYSDFLRHTSLVATHGFNYVKSSGDNVAGVALDQQSHDISLGLHRPIYGEVIGNITYGYSMLLRSDEERFGGDDTFASSFIGIGVDGPFLPVRRFPKLQSSASLSYRQSSVVGVGDTPGRYLSGNLGLSWSAREFTSFSVNASRSIDLTVSDRTVEYTRVGAGFNQQFGRSTNLNGSVGYTWSDTRGVDSSNDTLEAALSLGRTFNKYLSASVGYSYVDNQNSSVPEFRAGRFAGRSYERHTVTGSVTATF
jgi:hypothetical protein